jgi:hypothetical protein
MANNSKLSKPGLIPLKVENQGSLITTQVNKINFTGSGVTASVGQFNDLTILITGGGGSGVSSSYALTASFAATASYFSGSISNAISSSYALTASYFSGSISNAISSSYALSSSNALTASYWSGSILNAESASYALTASYWSGSILNAVSSSYALSSSNALTASYALNASSFPYTGSARITGSLGITGSTSLSGSAGTGSALLIYKSGSTVLDIQGSQGQLFSVVDTLTGSLMSVNDVSGLPILEVFSDDKVVLGTYGAPGLTVTGSQFFGTGSITGSLTGSLLGTGSWAISASQAISSSFTLNAISASYALSSSFAVTSSYARTASYVNPLTQSLLISGSTTITGSTNISGGFNLTGDINASSTTIILNSPSIALPGLAFPYSPSPTVNTVMFDTSNNVLFVTSSLPGGGGGGNATYISTGSITASVNVTDLFLIQSSSRELLKFNNQGVMVMEAYYITPTAITGGFIYSASGDFFVGL